MRKAGIALLIAGVLCVALGGMKFTFERELFSIGPLKASATGKRPVPGLRYAGAGLIGAGCVMALTVRKRGRKR
jgi:hypothetical protein